MVMQVTKGVKVCVETFYQEKYSNPVRNEHMFAYRITIENEGEHPIKLLNRQWYIFDATGEYREVSGEGVVGKQPVINPLDHYQYVSGCNLNSEMGRMYGYYEMQRLTDGKLFVVSIPEFEMIAPQKLN